jgi:hypothetical protein
MLSQLPTPLSVWVFMGMMYENFIPKAYTSITLFTRAVEKV